MSGSRRTDDDNFVSQPRLRGAIDPRVRRARGRAATLRTATLKEARR